MEDVLYVGSTRRSLRTRVGDPAHSIWRHVGPLAGDKHNQVHLAVWVMPPAQCIGVEHSLIAQFQPRYNTGVAASPGYRWGIGVPHKSLFFAQASRENIAAALAEYPGVYLFSVGSFWGICTKAGIHWGDLIGAPPPRAVV